MAKLKNFYNRVVNEFSSALRINRTALASLPATVLATVSTLAVVSITAAATGAAFVGGLLLIGLIYLTSMDLLFSNPRPSTGFVIADVSVMILRDLIGLHCGLTAAKLIGKVGMHYTKQVGIFGLETTEDVWNKGMNLCHDIWNFGKNVEESAIANRNEDASQETKTSILNLNSRNPNLRHRNHVSSSASMGESSQDTSFPIMNSVAKDIIYTTEKNIKKEDTNNNTVFTPRTNKEAFMQKHSSAVSSISPILEQRKIVIEANSQEIRDNSKLDPVSKLEQGKNNSYVKNIENSKWELNSQSSINR